VGLLVAPATLPAASTSEANLVGDNAKVSRPHFSIPPGQSRSFAVAAHRIRLRFEPGSSRGLHLPESFQPFAVSDEVNDMEIRVASEATLGAARGAKIFDSRLHWRVLRAGESTIFEFFHPPTALLYCRTTVRRDFSEAEVLFSESAWCKLTSADAGPRDWEIPYPLDQLLLVPALALRGAVLLHACGAVVSNRGLVFAGHSGDGKTTLAGLLAAEGIPLLSDERIAIRKTDDGFVAFGTPWPGEGNVVSNAAHPLAGMFVLRKAPRHALGCTSPSLAADLLARAIVPYYLPDTAARILEIFSDLAADVPFRELHFARSAGLASLLREAAREPRSRPDLDNLFVQLLNSDFTRFSP
jgi:hypothetical protein